MSGRGPTLVLVWRVSCVVERSVVIISGKRDVRSLVLVCVLGLAQGVGSVGVSGSEEE